MAITGAWKARQSVDAGAKKWGTGINPVHAIHSDDGRNVAPGTGLDRSVPADVIAYQDTFIYDDEGVYGNGHAGDTGIDTHPNWGDDTTEFREDADGFPQWGPYEDGIPGGSSIRTEKHGDYDQQTPNQVPNETVTEGWRNKAHGDVAYSRPSDDSQLVVTTSSVQRFKTREGSQTSGRADLHDAPVASRVVGRKVKPWSQGQRNADMFPRQQVQRIRGWWSRAAGTANPDLMQANEMYVSEPIQRSVPADPSVGKTDTNSAATYGYQPEDALYV